MNRYTQYEEKELEQEKDDWCKLLNNDIWKAIDVLGEISYYIKNKYNKSCNDLFKADLGEGDSELYYMRQQAFLELKDYVESIKEYDGKTDSRRNIF